jgi:hypothetical protein
MHVHPVLEHLFTPIYICLFCICKDKPERAGGVPIMKVKIWPPACVGIFDIVYGSAYDIHQRKMFSSTTISTA